jgi:cobalt transporter subunit CbtB
MNQPATSIARPGIASRQLPALAAIAFGIFIVIGAGFVQAHAVHEGTHDTRHAFGLPCH